MQLYVSSGGVRYLLHELTTNYTAFRRNFPIYCNSYLLAVTSKRSANVLTPYTCLGSGPVGDHQQMWTLFSPDEMHENTQKHTRPKLDQEEQPAPKGPSGAQARGQNCGGESVAMLYHVIYTMPSLCQQAYKRTIVPSIHSRHTCFLTGHCTCY